MKAGNRRPLGYATRRTGVLGLILAMGLLTIAPAHGLEWGRSTTLGALLTLPWVFWRAVDEGTPLSA